MKRFATFVLAAFLLVLGAPLTAAAEPAVDTPRLRLNVTQLNPRVITSTSTTLTVTGTVTNIGDRRISALQSRLELGEKLSTERQVRTAMSGTTPTGSSVSRFLDLSPNTLEPGQTAPLNLTVKLDGTAGDLRIGAAGIYPLLVNVNGTPAYGGQARLASLSLLLPVLGAPGKSTSVTSTQPAPVTMLWPIADTRPRVVAAPYGGQTVLGDDVLAGELRAGGRLYGLVNAALAVRDDPQLGRMLCYAIDPDLLDTVDAMSRGYQVRTPTGNVAGSGADAAKTWLDSLRRLVAGQCVIQMPYADADLPALAGVRGGDLMGYALNTTPRVQALLGVRPQAGVLWAEGPLDDTALGSVSASGVKTLIADPANLSGSVSGGVTVKGTPLRAEAVDSLVSTGFNGATNVPSGSATAVDDPAIGTQNGLATLIYRGMTGGTDEPVLVAPPRRWDVPETELTQLLQSMNELIGRKMMTAVGLPQLLAAPVTGTSTMNYTAENVASATPAAVTDTMATVESTMTDVRSAMTVDPAAQIDPDQLLVPLRYALVRNTASAWKSTKGAAVSATDSRNELDALLRAVTVDTPTVPISMASGSSPLPVFLHNTLPVQVAVRIDMNNSTGLRFGDSPDQLLPAGLSRNIPIQVEALRAGRFNVTVSLTTPGGTPLGNPARFELRSNEYGVVTLVLTIAGGAALVLLSGRQIYRRIRAHRAK